MIEHESQSTSSADLRAAAEERLADRITDARTLSNDDVRALVHELQVHQIELELQNEELQNACQQMDTLRAALDDLYQLAPVGYITLRPDGLILQANAAAGSMLGLDPGQLAGARFYRFIAPEDRNIYFAHRRHLKKSGRYAQCELRIQAKAGECRDVRLASLPKLDLSGRVVAYRTTLSDVTDLKRTERRLRVAASVVEATGEAVAITDPEGNIRKLNPAFLRLTGAGEKRAKGQPLLNFVDDASAQKLRAIWRTPQKQHQWAGELRIRGHDGEFAPVWASLSAVKDDMGLVTHVTAILTDMTGHKEAQKLLYQQANYDPVTGLPNRSLFAERLGQASRQAHRNNRSVALLFLDLDRFKQVNDSLGHAAGDELLAEVAKRLQHCIRENDSLARIGGDEFALILTDLTDGQNAAAVAEKAIEQLSAPFQIRGIEVHGGASIGIAVYPQNTRDLDTLRRYADLAMYEAKEAGRKAFRFFSQAMTDVAINHLQIETELRLALKNGEFSMRYQPIYRLRSNELLGVEGLLRWDHPSHGLLTPDHFLSVAEDSGLIRDLGEWVLATACHDARVWRRASGLRHLSLCVNLSGHQLNNPLAYARLRHSIDRCRQDRVDLVLEITETVAMDSIHGIWERLHALREDGIQLAMDDFGKGYSSLGTLKDLPFNIIKIDKSFVQDLAEGRASPLVDAIIAMAHGLGLLVIAEGVESAEQMQVLASKGCDAAQGYYFSQPVEATAMDTLIAKTALGSSRGTVS